MDRIRLKVDQLQPGPLPPSDPERTTTTLEHPPTEEARRVVAAVLRRELERTGA